MSDLEPKAKYRVYLTKSPVGNIDHPVGLNTLYASHYDKGEKELKVYCPNIHGLTGEYFENEYIIPNKYVSKIEEIIYNPVTYYKKKKFQKMYQDPSILSDLDDLEESDED